MRYAKDGSGKSRYKELICILSSFTEDSLVH